MKKILVPTDFSENAENALNYAVDFAGRFGSTITLLHLYKVHSTTGMFISVESYMKEDAAQQMLAAIEKLENQLQENGVVIESKIIRGDAVPFIANMADQSGYDLIIMGTQGASGLKEIFFGSTTNGVVRHTHTPVLAIPSGFTSREIKNIVLAIDELELSHPESLQPLVKIAKSCKAHLRIYHKDTGEGDPGIDPTLDRVLEDIEHSFHYELDTENLNSSIQAFVKDSQADLLCMIRRKRGFLNQVFHVSATSKEVFRSAIPLLVLQDVE